MTFDLLVKFVAGDKLNVSVEDSWTIKQIKEQVLTLKESDAPIESVKLIHKGLNLENDVTVSEANIIPTSYLVCVISKTSLPQKPAEPTPDSKVQDKPKPSAPTSTINAELSNELVNRGYPRESADFALRATHNTLANALLLLERVPPTLLSRLQPDDPLIQIAQNQVYPQFLSMLKNNDLENAFVLLESSSPGITQQLRTRVSDLLELVTPTLGHDGGSGHDEDGMITADDIPQIQVEDVMAHIDGLPNSEKREILLDMGFSEDIINSLLAAPQPTRTPHNPSDVPQTTSTITPHLILTPDENQAIDRLVDIFCMPREAVVDAFFVCDRNEEYTANFLTENQFF